MIYYHVGVLSFIRYRIEFGNSMLSLTVIDFPIRFMYGNE